MIFAELALMNKNKLEIVFLIILLILSNACCSVDANNKISNKYKSCLMKKMFEFDFFSLFNMILYEFQLENSIIQDDCEREIDNFIRGRNSDLLSKIFYKISLERVFAEPSEFYDF